MSSIIIRLVQPNSFFGRLNTESESLEPEAEGLWLDKLIASQWKNKCKKDSVFELDCVHGKDCQRINGCRCADVEKCDLNEKKRAEEWKQANKHLARNVRRRVGYKPKPQAELSLPKQQNKDSTYNDFESFVEEHFSQ